MWAAKLFVPAFCDNVSFVDNDTTHHGVGACTSAASLRERDGARHPANIVRLVLRGHARGVSGVVDAIVPWSCSFFSSLMNSSTELKER